MTGPRLTRRQFALASAGLGASLVLGPPSVHLASAWLRDGRGERPLPEGVTDDASHLESARMGEIVRVTGTTEEAVAQVRAALERASDRRWPVCIAGARHTMGGHTIAPGGLLLDLAGVRSLALRGQTLVAGAGACWRDVIPFLESHGRAVEVMQSNFDFSIGGSLGANCHGWQPRRAPIVSTVEAFTMVLADGRVVRASRTESPELFTHAIGGYGLFGVMVEAELRVASNVLCEAGRRAVSLDDLSATLARECGEDAELAFGRLSILPTADRFEEALVTVYRRVEGALPPLAPTPADDAARWVVRGQLGSDYGKYLRWICERELGGEMGVRASRNQLMSEPVRRFGNRRRDTSDILFEGFVAPESAAAYAREVRRIVIAHDADLLNVTVRHVLPDRDSVLRYATREVLGFVMLFPEPRSRAGDERTRATTTELVDATLDHGGRYYLPYRDHASRAQFVRSYPESVRFAEAKHRWDPALRFQNRFWHRYLA